MKKLIHSNSTVTLALLAALVWPVGVLAQATEKAPEKEKGVEVGEASYNIADCSEMKGDTDAGKDGDDAGAEKLDLDECKKVKK